MAIKFNPLVISNLANRFATVFFTSTYAGIRLYPASVPYSSTALPTTGAGYMAGGMSVIPSGHLWGFDTGGNSTFGGAQNGNTAYASNLIATTANAVATGTVAWGLIYTYSMPNYSFSFSNALATDAISVSDPTSVIRVNTLNAVSGQPLSITGITLTLGAQ